MRLDMGTNSLFVYFGGEANGGGGCCVCGAAIGLKIGVLRLDKRGEVIGDGNGDGIVSGDSNSWRNSATRFAPSCRIRF